MSPYQKKLEELYKLEFFGMKLGLDNIRALLNRIGNPHRKFQSIHIAGTNGKGSVSAMLSAIHQKFGKKTGLYTSPHLVEFGERIRINGVKITELEVLNFLERVWPVVEELHSTFFEVTTAMAFDHFAQNKVDIAIIETGLGGRLDATNVLENPLATVVTSIGHDHHAQLGPTLEDVAREKAGIFKPSVPAIVNCLPELNIVFLNRAREMKSPLILLNRHKRTVSKDTFWNPPFPGKHQVENVRTVRAVLKALPYRIPVGIAREAIRETTVLTGMRGRLDLIKIPNTNRKLWLDVGHNPEAIEAVSQFFRCRKNRPIVIFGIMRDKDVDEVLNIIKSFAASLISIAADTPRALPSAELAQKAKKIGINARDGQSTIKALHTELQSMESSDILLAGSHYIVGEFLQNFPMESTV